MGLSDTGNHVDSKEREVFIVDSFPVNFHLFKRRMGKEAEITLTYLLKCLFHKTCGKELHMTILCTN